MKEAADLVHWTPNQTLEKRQGDMQKTDAPFCHMLKRNLEHIHTVSFQ